MQRAFDLENMLKNVTIRQIVKIREVKDKRTLKEAVEKIQAQRKEEDQKKRGGFSLPLAGRALYRAIDHRSLLTCAEKKKNEKEKKTDVTTEGERTKETEGGVETQLCQESEQNMG